MQVVGIAMSHMYKGSPPSMTIQHHDNIRTIQFFADLHVCPCYCHISSIIVALSLQVSAVGQTVSLLDASLIDMQAAAAALVRFDAPMEDSIAAAEMVSHADARAESISQMAR